MPIDISMGISLLRKVNECEQRGTEGYFSLLRRGPAFRHSFEESECRASRAWHESESKALGTKAVSAPIDLLPHIGLLLSSSVIGSDISAGMKELNGAYR
jgi:hypothetical protein